MCFLPIFIYNIALQNTTFGVLQKSSKHFSDLHFLSTILFPHAPAPPPSKKKYKKLGPISLQFCS